MKPEGWGQKAGLGPENQRQSARTELEPRAAQEGQEPLCQHTQAPPTAWPRAGWCWLQGRTRVSCGLSEPRDLGQGR